MKQKEVFHHPISWIVFSLLSLLGVFYIYQNFEKANSLINVDIQMDRGTALQKAAQLARDYEIGPQDFKQAAAFRNDVRFQNFVELEAGGIDSFTQIISTGLYESYHWSVRHFKEKEANEVVFWFKPNGDIYGFSEKIPEAKEGASLEQEEALRIAEHHAIYNWDVDLYPYTLIEKSKEEQINGRIDHTFVYEHTNLSAGEGKFRITLVVSGNKLSKVDYSVKIPEDFDRRYSEMRSANETISAISTAAIVLIYGLLGVLFGIFILIRKRRLIWKPAMFWGLGISIASVFLVGLNSLPFAWFAFDTSMSQSNFLIREILNGFLGAIAMGALLALSFMAAEGLGRMAFPSHVQWWKIWSKKSGGSISILGQTIAGYLFAILILAIDVLFYVTTTSHMGWWSPAGTLSDPNILATYLPWLDSIAISLQAGFWEEALFRAVPIAGIYLLTKGKKSRKIWIILVLFIQTLIFGAGHANYAQQPSYARVVEMIIPFIIMGIIYIYYGILPAVIAHFAVDVFWFSLPLWVSSTPGIWIDRSLVLFFLFLPALMVLFIRYKNKKWTRIPDKERNSGWLVPEMLEKETEEVGEIITENKPNIEKWAIPLGITGIVIWMVFSPFKTDVPELTLPKNNAIDIAKNELAERYTISIEDWTILTSVEDNVDVRDIFVWQEGGEDTYKNLMHKFLAPPYWKIRLVKTKGKAEDKTEEYIVHVTNEKTIMGIFHKTQEKAPGKNLEKPDAQHIIDSVLLAQFALPRTSLKEISVTPKKQDSRTDWEFIYADTTNFPMEKGQGRYVIELSGDEVTSSNPYVHIPEEWIRDYKEIQSKNSIIRIGGNILIFGTIFLGLVLAIIQWTRKKFKLKVFVALTFLSGSFFFIQSWNQWASHLSAYDTQIPMGNFITTLIIGLAISGIFSSLFNGIFIAASPGWLPMNKKQGKWNVVYALSLGVFIASLFAVVQKIVPDMKPTWPDFSYLNGSIPWADFAFSKTLNILYYPIFASILFLGIQRFTKNYTASKWVGVVFILLAGMAITGIQFESYPTWIISGLVLSALLFSVYYFFIRFHVEWIPFCFGTIPILGMLKTMIISKETTVITGGLIMIGFSFALLYWWTKLLTKK